MDKAELERVLNAGSELMFRSGCTDAMVVFWALSVVHTLEMHELIDPQTIAEIYGNQVQVDDHFTVGEVNMQPMPESMTWRVW